MNSCHWKSTGSVTAF